MNNFSDGFNLLWIVKGWSASPSDILGYLNDIANLRFRGSTDSKHCSADVQYLKAASWSLEIVGHSFSTPSSCHIDISTGTTVPANVEIHFSLILRHIFEIQFPQMSVSKNSCCMNMQQGKHKRNHDLPDSF